MNEPAKTSSNSFFRSKTQNGNPQKIEVKEKSEQLLPANNENKKWTAKIFDVAISVSLVAIFFGMPVFFTGFTAQGISFEKQIYFYFWILIALIAWVSDSVIKGEMKIRRTPLDIPIIIFWIVFLLATIFSVDKWHSFWGFFGDPSHGFINVSAGIISFYLILSHFNLNRLRLMLGSIIASGLVVVIWEILVVRDVLRILNQNYISVHHWAQNLPVSLLGSISSASIFLGVLIIILVTVFLKVKASAFKKAWKAILMFVFLLMILASLYVLLAFYSFVPWPGIFIGIGFFLIYMLARVVNAGKGATWLPMAVFVVILAMLLIGNALATSSQVIKVQLPLEVNPQLQLSWQVAKETVKNNFFLGTGPATYGHDFALYYPQDFNLNELYNLQFYQGSGALWEALPTLGALGTFALILLMISFLSVNIYLLSKGKGEDKIFSLGTLSAILIILISAFITKIDGSMIIFGMLLATLTTGIVLLEGNAKEEYSTLSLKTSPKYALALAFVFLVVSAGVVFLFVFLGRVYVADVLVGIASRQQTITEESSVKKINKAINLYSKEGRYYTLAGQQYMILANNEFLKGEKADKNLISQYLEKSIVLTAKGKELMPKDVMAVFTLAQAQENKSVYLAQFFDQAITSYNDALALEPNSPDIYSRLGQMKARQASVERDSAKRKNLLIEASDLFQKSIDKKNNFALGYHYLSIVQDQLGDSDKALESAKNAASLNNTDKNILLNLATLLKKKGGDENLKTSEYLYQQILRAFPNDTNALLNLGLLYEKQGKSDQAIKQYQKAKDALSQSLIQSKAQIQALIDNINKGISNEPGASVSTDSEEGLPGTQE